MESKWSIDKLHEWDKNPRDITPEAFERLKKHIIDHGQMQPIVITPDGEVLGGNMRIKVYRELGIKEVWVKVVTPKDEAEKLRIALVLNDRAGHYEEDLLLDLAKDMPDFNFDDYSIDIKEPTNFGDLVEQSKEVVEDEVPEVSTEPAISKLGEVYQLGKHRLMCGDSTKIEDVEKLMDGKKADMVFTDPPYGVDYQSNMRTKSDKFEVLDNDDKMISDWIAPATMFSTGWVLFCTTWKVLSQWFEIGKQIGDLSNMIIWDKGGGGIGDLEHSLSTDYEILLAYGRGKEIIGKRIGSVWGIGKDNPNVYTHPTQKPVELAGLAIRTFSKGDVLDLFGGSGSTLIACEQTNRTCYMMELDPKYIDVIRKRYSKFIGKENEWQTETPKI